MKTLKKNLISCLPFNPLGGIILCSYKFWVEYIFAKTLGYPKESERTEQADLQHKSQ